MKYLILPLCLLASLGSVGLAQTVQATGAAIEKKLNNGTAVSGKELLRFRSDIYRMTTQDFAGIIAGKWSVPVREANAPFAKRTSFRECADSSLYAFRRFWKQQVDRSGLRFGGEGNVVVGRPPIFK